MSYQVLMSPQGPRHASFPHLGMTLLAISATEYKSNEVLMHPHGLRYASFRHIRKRLQLLDPWNVYPELLREMPEMPPWRKAGRWRRG